MSRDKFEDVLGAMARAELLALADAVFEKEGKRIPYRTVSILPAGLHIDEKQPAAFLMKDAAVPAASAKRSKGRALSRKTADTAAQSRSKPAKTAALPSDRQARLEQALRAWRLTEAKRRNMPAFRIFGDRTLRSIATACPKTDSALLAVPGIGMGTVEKYGGQIYHLIASAE
jgi:superfamily II DNA helicase RecQ